MKRAPESRVTIDVVAEEAGVSSTTVSYVLSGKRPVAPSTRRRVENAIEKLGFAPSATARFLRTGHSPSIPLIIPDVANPYYAQLTRGLQDALRSSDRTVIVCNSNGNRQEEIDFLAEAEAQRVAGVVLSPVATTPADLETLQRANVPVIIQGDGPIDGCDLVTSDLAGAVRDVVEHLVSRGHTRMAVIAGPRGLLTGDPRHDVFLRECGARGIAVAEEHIGHAPHTRDSGYALMKAFLSTENPPTAVFCVNDVVAVGALQAVKESGLSIPRDIAIVGCDDVDVAELVEPRLTSVHLDPYEIGKTCGELLLERLSGRREFRRVSCPTRLTVRDSS